MTGALVANFALLGFVTLLSGRFPVSLALGPAQSVGSTAKGELRGGRQVPMNGDTLAVLPAHHHRKLNWGTDYLVATLERASRYVRRRHPGSVLLVGNLSRRRGGPIGFSVSHQSGRDVDIAFYVRDHLGAVAQLRNLVHFDDQGKAIHHLPRLVFDVPRNWSLVAGLLSDRQIQVQWIFVSDGLREALLAHAKRSGAPTDLIERANSVLRQPLLSSNHDDHFHLRVRCSLRDRLGGCTDYGPTWRWIDTFEKEVAARARQLIDVVRRSRPSRARNDALELLGKLRSRAVALDLAQLLNHPHAAIRLGAANALAQAPTVAVVDTIVRTLRRRPEFVITQRLLSALDKIDAPQSLEVLHQIALNRLQPARHLRQATVIRVRAVQLLASRSKKVSVPVLIQLLTEDHGGLRQSAALALRAITNQSFGVSWTHRQSRTQRLYWHGKWTAWWARHKQLTRWGMVLRGFQRAGVRFSQRQTAEQFPLLIRMIFKRPPHLSINAQWALARLSGVAINPHRWESKLKSYKYWRAWWARHHQQFGATSVRL